MTHPEPEVRARRPLPGETPPNAARLEQAAHQRGWVTAVTYARGNTPGRDPDVPGPVVDHVMLRAAHPSGRRAAATWEDRKFRTGWTWIPGVILQRANSRDVKAWIDGAPHPAGCDPDTAGQLF